ncbi:FadR/GntR family transcriptional regulator [uncultured Xylophilus sp.]|uniref:FadR/GntR family transcriptional regulator n=1 Tax=uncultured Xylophilus sp. TaxID=296832 RepID=UPI0025D61556|nr:FadR/GntR family transcriptional regulator [uncultured Xylophilus sp.]
MHSTPSVPSEPSPRAEPSAPPSPTPVRPGRPSRGLAHGLVEDIGTRIAGGVLQAGDRLPTESAIMQTYGVSRTVVREALSRLQAAGLVETRHGIGTFVLPPSAPTGGIFRLHPADISGSIDAIAVLELRISLETEAAALAAQRRSPAQLAAMRDALEQFRRQVEQGGDTVAPDFRFHCEIADATGNRYFSDILDHLGKALIPRTRIVATHVAWEDQSLYLQRVHREHEDIVDAIERSDADAARAAMRVHLNNSRERLKRAREAAQASTASATPV